MQMDDKTFQAFLLDTQVMLTKDHGKWNFDTLQELVEGPLHNPKRMEEAIKVSRYIRKLMSFFHPMAHRFSGLPKTKVDFSFFISTTRRLTSLFVDSSRMYDGYGWGVHYSTRSWRVKTESSSLLKTNSCHSYTRVLISWIRWESRVLSGL